MPKKFGSRSEVYDENAEMTRGGLRKADLIVSRTGRIVSKKKSEMARTAYEKYGFNKRAAKEVKEVGATGATGNAVDGKKKRRRRRKKTVDTKDEITG